MRNSEARSQESEVRTKRARSAVLRLLAPGSLLLTSYLWLLAPALCAATHVTATYGLPAGAQVMATVNGTSEYGLVFVQRNESVTWNGTEYGATTIEGYLNASGQLNDGAGNLDLDIVPNTDASPSDTYYVATVNIQGQVHSEIWVVPDETTVDATLIRQSQAPAATGATLYYQTVEQSGAAMAQRQALNFTGTGVSCADDSALGRTDCTITAGSGGGSGTVTSFSAGSLTPLFGASVTNPTTTPALSFSLSTAGAHQFFGNDTGSTAAPGYVQPAFSDLSGTAADAQLAGSYSGTGSCAAHQWVDSLGRDAAPGCAQPAYSDLTGTPQMANSFSGVSHEWLNSYSASTGNFTATQPAFSDLTGSIAIGQTPLTTLGDLLYANSTPGLARLAGNTTSTLDVLTQTGNGTVSAAPAWNSLAGINVPVESGTITTGDCVKWASGTSITDAGAACGSGGSGTYTFYVSFDQCSPAETTNAGNSFWTVARLTAWDAGHWEFVNAATNVSGDIYCSVRIPHNVAATPTAQIALSWAVNATSGNQVLQTCDAAVGTSGSFNPASLTCATAQTVTVPGTAYNRTVTTFAVQSSVSADQILLVKIHKDSTSTLTSANLLLFGAYLEINETL